MRGILIVSTAIAFSLAACGESTKSSTQGTKSSASRNLTEEEIALRNDKDTYNTTVVEGAVIGALAGAVLGQLAGGDTQSTLLGAAAGGAIGGATGFYVADKQASYASAENQLDGAIQFAREDNQKLTRTVALSENVIAADRARLTELKNGYAVGTVTKEQYNAELKQVKSNRDDLAEISRDVSQRLAKQRENANHATQTYGSVAASPLVSEVNTMSSKDAALKSALSQADVLLTSFRLDA